MFELDAGGVWIKELRTGRERQLAVTSRTPLNPVISADGRHVGYTVAKLDQGGQSGAGQGLVIATSGGTPQRVCDDCIVHQLLDRGRAIVVGPPTSVTLIDARTGDRQPLLQSDQGMGRVMVSPTERWISFNSEARSWLAPFSPGNPPDQREWSVTIDIQPGSGERPAGWSPDGRLLYVLLERDGFRCLYGQRIDERNGRPVGEPFPIYHFHSPSLAWRSTGYGSAIVEGLFVSLHSELRSNLWQGRLEKRGLTPF